MELPTQHILIEFIGGDADGKYYDSESENKMESMAAKMIFNALDGIGVEATFQSPPMEMMEQLFNNEPFEFRTFVSHRYQVIEWIEEGNEIYLRLGYRGPAVIDQEGTPAG